MPEIESEKNSVKEVKDGEAAALADGASGGEKVEKENGIPAGVLPLFFSGAGQQIFDCVVDKDLTTETPHKLVPKKMILEDFKNRAAVSDFHPVKKKVQEYPGEELLLVYDYDFKYGENFYICVTEEAKELVLNPPKDEKEGKGEVAEEEEDEIPKTPEPREWECLGSDLEIKDGHFQETRPLLKYSVSRKLRHFESPVTFTSISSTSSPANCIDIESQPDPNFDLLKLEMETSIQAIPETVESHSQTEWMKPCNKAIQYSPRQLSDSEIQNLLNDADMKDFIDVVSKRVEFCVQQNLIMDVFVDDYKLLSDTDGFTGKKSDTTLKEYQSFADLRFSKNKIITWVEWHPTIKGIIAVSCGENHSFDERVDLSTLPLKKQSLVLIWSFTDPIHPVLFLEAPDSVLCFSFNPTDPNLIVGGCINGQIILWNIEQYQDHLQINKATESSESRTMLANTAIFDTDPKLDHAPIVQYCVTASIKDGHSREVCDIQWLPHNIEVCQKTANILENPSHQCNQIITCSIDGTVMLWDIRQQPQKSQAKNLAHEDQLQPFSHLDLIWRPFNKIPLPRLDAPGTYSATRVSIKEKQTELPKGSVSEEILAQRSAIGQGALVEGASSMFFVGTEDGEVVHCDWKPTRDAESGKLTPSLPSHSFTAHSGPITCVERSPFFRDILLTVGGCTWIIWKEDAKSGYLLSSSYSSVPVTGGAWSPTRPGVFFIIKKNGNVEVWDLMDRSHEALLTQNISSFSLTSVFPFQLTSKQLMLAVGDSAGTLHILEIPWNLSLASSKEVVIMETFFEGEVERLQFTSDRMSKRALEKKARDAAVLDEKEVSAPSVQEKSDEKSKTEYDNYLSMELKLLMQLGVIQSNTATED